MTILAFDASTPRLVVSARCGDREAHLDLTMGLRHQEELIPTLETALAMAGTTIGQVEGIVCGRGPGSFTGLRVAMAAAKALALSLQRPLVSISALDAMAWGVSPRPAREGSPLLLPVIDARKGRFYGAVYRQGQRQGSFLDLGPRDWAAHLYGDFDCSRGVLVCGPDADAFYSLVQEEARVAWHRIDSGARTWGPGLLALGEERILAGNWDTPDAEPEYVRKSDAELGITLEKARDAGKVGGSTG